MFADSRDKLSQLCNEVGFSSLYQSFIICEKVDPSTPRSAQVACAAAIKYKTTEKYSREVMKDRLKGPVWVKNIKVKDK